MVVMRSALDETPRSFSYEPSGRLVHLRWAVAELEIALDTPSEELDRAARALDLFSEQGLLLLEQVETEEEAALSEACVAAALSIVDMQAALAQPCALRTERAMALQRGRRELHHALVSVAEALAQLGGPPFRASSGFRRIELDGRLALRQAFSCYRAGLVSAGEERARLAWALEVANAELSILLAHARLCYLPLPGQRRLRELSVRISAWARRPPQPPAGRSLYREALSVCRLTDELSLHPLVAEHDAIELSELWVLPEHEAPSGVLEARLLGLVGGLRGFDEQLDRLELGLLYGDAEALIELGQRVTELRARVGAAPFATIALPS